MAAAAAVEAEIQMRRPTFPQTRGSLALFPTGGDWRNSNDSPPASDASASPPAAHRQQSAAWIQTDEVFDKEGERHVSICLGQVGPV